MHNAENTDDLMLKIIVQKQIVIIISVLISLRFILQHDKKYVTLSMFCAVFVMRIRFFFFNFTKKLITQNVAELYIILIVPSILYYTSVKEKHLISLFNHTL